jgi:nicotinamidase-related amidase
MDLAPRTSKNDHLLTPDNSVLLVIDYQPTQINSVNSMLRELLIDRIVAVAELARGFKVPTVPSTVNVATGRNKPTIPRLAKVLEGVASLDRTTINAWEGAVFLAAVKATGRKKIIIAGLWTEACVAFTALDALQEGYEVYPIVDAIGGTSVVAHETALRRMEQAGAKLISLAQLACELQRDWNRTATVEVMVKALTEGGAFLKM